MLHENCTQGRTVADGKALQVDVRCGVALVVLEDAGRHRGHIVAAIALHAAMPSGFQGQASGQHVCGAQQRTSPVMYSSRPTYSGNLS